MKLKRDITSALIATLAAEVKASEKAVIAARPSHLRRATLTPGKWEM
jgi:hypothetical protein